MRVVELARTDGIAICSDEDGERHEVAVDLLGALAIGDQILVHAGVAIAMACLPEFAAAHERTTS